MKNDYFFKPAVRRLQAFSLMLIMLLCVPLTAQSKKSVVVSVVPIFQSNLKQLNFEYVDLSVYDFSSVPHWTDDEVLKAGDNPPWKVYASQIKTVWILPDFKNVELTSLANWFSGCTNLESISGLDNLNTSKVTSMRGTFSSCYKLTSIDISNFNTSQVTTFEEMFLGCFNLKSISWPESFNTSRCIWFNSMFQNCQSLTSIDCNFNCANATSLARMFVNCNNLSSLDLSIFTNTSNVAIMSEMFIGCENLEHISIPSSFDTSSVKDMTYMFLSCNNLKSITFPNSFNTSKVKFMSYMFGNCASLTELNLDMFNTAQVTDMSGMFNNCLELEKLNITSFRTDNVTNMEKMFRQCLKLKTLELQNFSTAKVTTMNGMFENCFALTTIYCNGNWKSSAQSNNMFRGCSKLVGAISYDQNKVDNTYANCDNGYFTSVEDYGIRISGVPVTSINCRDLSHINGVTVSAGGYLRYNPGTNTLEMENVSIDGGDTHALRNTLSGLIIKVGHGPYLGYNVLTAAEGKTAMSIEAPTTIRGNKGIFSKDLDGCLLVGGKNVYGIYINHSDLTIEDASVMVMGTMGIWGYSNHGICRGTLSLKGFAALGVDGKESCIKYLQQLNLDGHIQIVKPAGAVFANNAVRYSSDGDVVINKMEIRYYNPADVNLDQKVDISDIVAVINTIAGDDTYRQTGDVNSDNNIDISDIVAIINVIAGGEIPLPASSDAATKAGYCPDTNHPHVIDLGSAGKWACCNVGASAPWEYGGYYAWGETDYKDTYDYSTYTLWDYGLNMPQILGDIKGNTAYDVAAKKWEGNWHMPNSAQIVNLYKNVKSTEKVTLKDVNGMKITASNGNAIFIPFGGYIDGSEKKKVGEEIYLWSSTQAEPYTAFTLYSDGSSFTISLISKCLGLNIRPVAE